MSRRGQTVAVGFMIAFWIFLLVVIAIQPLKESIGIARDSSHLDCGNASITTGNSMSCIMVDSYLPLYIGFGLAVAIAYLGIREYRESNGGGQ